MLLVIFYFIYRKFGSQHAEQIFGLQIFDHFGGQVNGKSAPQEGKYVEGISANGIGSVLAQRLAFAPEYVNAVPQPSDRCHGDQQIAQYVQVFKKKIALRWGGLKITAAKIPAYRNQTTNLR